jgi:hypothetical protein
MSTYSGQFDVPGLFVVQEVRAGFADGYRFVVDDQGRVHTLSRVDFSADAWEDIVPDAVIIVENISKVSVRRSQ